MGAAGHQIITCTFRGGTGQNRRFHIQEAVLIQITAHTAGNARTQLQLGCHFRATQIDKAVAQTGFFTDIAVLVQRERRGFGLVQHFKLITQYFNGAGGHVGIARTLRTQTHLATDLHHIFTAYPIRQGKGLFAIRIEYHLRQTLAVTDIEKDNPAMITATVNPAAKGDFLIRQCFVQLAAIVATHHGVVFL